MRRINNNILLRKFTEADDIEVADYLIEHGNGYSLMSEYKKFKWLNDNHIVKKLLEYNAYQAIIDFLRRIQMNRSSI